MLSKGMSDEEIQSYVNFWNLAHEYTINGYEIHLVDCGGKGHIELHETGVSAPLVHSFTSRTELPEKLGQLLRLVGAAV